MSLFRTTVATLALLCLVAPVPISLCQQAAPLAAQLTSKEKSDSKPELPFQIQLLETHIRFEANGDSRKDVHTIVHINNILGAHQFARIAFDYNRSFQQVEIPLIRISHANGGTSEVLPSAVTDAPNPAVEPYPAYHDVRVKSVRILGLQEGDTLEYRVVTATTKHPLAPDFWLEHSFDRSGQVLHEQYELDVEASLPVKAAFPQSTPSTQTEQIEQGRKYTRYSWDRFFSPSKADDAIIEKAEPDVLVTTFPSWGQLAERLAQQIVPSEETAHALRPKAKEIVGESTNPDEWIHSFYDFVSQKIKTVDVPLGATGFHTRPPTEILSSGYATAEDKFMLFASLSNNFCGPARAGLVNGTKAVSASELPRPSLFDHLLTMSGYPSINIWMDLNLEVAPYRMIPAQFQHKPTLVIGPAVSDVWQQALSALPYTPHQRVDVEASVESQGALRARVKYVMRGENELLLRIAFHQAPKDKWKDVANLLALSDGFRGQITSVNASDPMDTKGSFTVEYELTQAKFVDWSKKPVRIPALLPQISMPDLPTAAAPGQPAPPIELGTPLEVQTTMTLHLPPGTTVETPPGTSVSRDYATFTSKYSATQNTVTASRHINFLKRQLPPERAIDYNAFLQAVQNDQAQRLILVPPSEIGK